MPHNPRFGNRVRAHKKQRAAAVRTTRFLDMLVIGWWILVICTSTINWDAVKAQPGLSLLVGCGLVIFLSCCGFLLADGIRKRLTTRCVGESGRKVGGRDRAWIQNATYEDMAYRWENGSPGDSIFRGESGHYYKEVMDQKRGQRAAPIYRGPRSK